MFHNTDVLGFILEPSQLQILKDRIDDTEQLSILT